MSKIAELEGKWDGVEEVNILRLVKEVPRLGYYLVVLRKLVEAGKPTRRQLRAGR